MKFKLNEYHRNISDEELLNDIKKTAKKIGCNCLTKHQYSDNGQFNPSTLINRFGSWEKVLILSGIELSDHYHPKCDWTDEEIIADIQMVAAKLNSKTVTARDYDKNGHFSASTLIKRYGSWNKLLEISNLQVNLNRNFTDEDLLQEIERMWILLGRQPTSTDIKAGISKYSLQSYTRRFGGWRGALETFVAWISDDNKEEANCDETKSVVFISETENSLKNITKHTTSRDINLRLRFRVMQRDNFKCCACGASPSKDPSVVLHVDHIVPWSKGGETVLNNLQTLCSDCNLGKSDIL